MPHHYKSPEARLAAIYEFSVRLGSTLNLNKLFSLITDSMLTLTEAERGVILLKDPLTGELGVVATRDISETNAAVNASEISMSVVERAVSSEIPILTNNAQEDVRFSAHESVVGYQLRSILCAPLRARGRVIGVVYVDNRYLTGVFEQDDLDLLVTFANQAAMAIENARLFNQTDLALARRVEELSLFQQIDRDLNESLDLNRVLSNALNWAVRLTHAASGSVGLLNETFDGRELEVLVRIPEGSMMQAVSAPIMSQILSTGSSVRSRNDNVTPRRGSAPTTQLTVPIKADGNVLGVIMLESPYANAFTDEDDAFMERLADRAAVAIKNSRLYYTVSQIQQRQSDFLALVSHELRSPMAAIKGYVEILEETFDGRLSSEQQDYLDIVNRNVDQMHVLVQDLAALQELQSDHMQFVYQKYDLARILQETVRDFHKTVARKNQHLRLEAEPNLKPVWVDKTRTSQILVNLISNAHKYTQAGGEITVRAFNMPQQPFVTVEVEDTGVGMSAEDQAKLFTRFYRVNDDSVRSERGWGLGLSIVKQLVEAQGGEITVDSQAGLGSKFVFTLPASQETHAIRA